VKSLRPTQNLDVVRFKSRAEAVPRKRRKFEYASTRITKREIVVETFLWNIGPAPTENRL